MRNESLPFKPRARMLLLLGDQLIRDAGIAIFELVKNAYDADATSVNVTLSHVKNRERGCVIVEDNGCGMDWDQIVNVWLEPGTDYRYIQKIEGYRSPRFNRFPLGEKGVGRFAAHKVGKKIKLITRKHEGSEIVVDVDWGDFDTERYLSDARVSVIERDPEYFTHQATGTKIEITDLNEEIARGTVRQISRAINSVCSPFKGPAEFIAKLIVRPQDDSLEGILNIENVLELAPYRATCIIDNNVLTYDYDFVPINGMDRISGRSVREKVHNIPALDMFAELVFPKQIGPLLLDFRMYDLDAQILEFAVSDKRGFKDFLKQNGGVRVYRDGVRIYDYGEPGNDWLDLGGARVNFPTARISNNQIIAAVHLDGCSSKGLVEKTNREGFSEDSNYQLFRNVVLYALTQIVFERNVDKERLRAIYTNKKMKEPVISELLSLRDIVEKYPIVKNEIGPLINNIEDQYVEMRDRLLTVAGAGLTLTVTIHEVEKAIKGIAIAIERNAPIQELKEMSVHLNELIEGLTYLTRKSGRRKEKCSDIIKQVLMNVNYRLKAHDIKITNGIENGNPDFSIKCTKRLIISTLMNFIDNSIYWLSTKGAGEKLIYIGSSSDLDGGPVLFVADNGPGFQDPPDLLVQPFMTRKPEGMGLGLHIANEIMKVHDGRLIFPDREDVGIESDYCGAISGLQFKEMN